MTTLLDLIASSPAAGNEFAAVNEGYSGRPVEVEANYR